MFPKMKVVASVCSKTVCSSFFSGTDILKIKKQYTVFPIYRKKSFYIKLQMPRKNNQYLPDSGGSLDHSLYDQIFMIIFQAYFGYSLFFVFNMYSMLCKLT